MMSVNNLSQDLDVAEVVHRILSWDSSALQLAASSHNSAAAGSDGSAGERTSR